VEILDFSRVADLTQVGRKLTADQVLSLRRPSQGTSGPMADIGRI
jgi:hypothetical protein